MGLLPIGTTIVIALLRRKTRYFGAGRILGLLLLVSLLALRVWDPGLTETIRLKSFDIYQLMYPRVARQELAAVVDIDERSLQALGQWPWPRTVMAEMVSKIVEHGGTVIGFDVLFPEPDRSSPEVAAETFQGLDQATRETLRQLPGNDAVFAEAIRRSKVVLGQSGYRVAGGAPIAHPPIQTGIATIGPDPRLYLVDFPHLLRNLPLLDGAADGHGIFSIIPERDGVVRRVPVVAVADGTIVPSLSLEMLRVLPDRVPSLSKAMPAASGVSVSMPSRSPPTARAASGSISRRPIWAGTCPPSIFCRGEFLPAALPGKWF